jgi:hypothetical protein
MQDPPRRISNVGLMLSDAGPMLSDASRNLLILSSRILSDASRKAFKRTKSIKHCSFYLVCIAQSIRDCIAQRIVKLKM